MWMKGTSLSVCQCQTHDLMHYQPDHPPHAVGAYQHYLWLSVWQNATSRSIQDTSNLQQACIIYDDRNKLCAHLESSEGVLSICDALTWVGVWWTPPPEGWPYCIWTYDLRPSLVNIKLQIFCLLVCSLGLQWAWSCVDKLSNTVLQESLVAMFTWYRGLSLTVVYLHGISLLLQEPGGL